MFNVGGFEKIKMGNNERDVITSFQILLSEERRRILRSHQQLWKDGAEKLRKADKWRSNHNNDGVPEIDVPDGGKRHSQT